MWIRRPCALRMPAAMLLGLALARGQGVPTIGRVVDADGTPVAGAAVTFACSPCAGAAFGTPILVHTTADGDGRFRVLLRGGRSHSAWAIAPAVPGHATPRRCSAVVEGLQPGTPVTLTAALHAQPTELRLERLGALGPAKPPFELEVFGDSSHAPKARVPIAADGSVSLPDFAAPGWLARIVSADGSVLTGCSVRASDAGGPHVSEAERLQVVDEDGAPVAGARVGALVTGHVGRWAETFRVPRTLGSLVVAPPTDADGMTTFVVNDCSAPFFAWHGERVARLGHARGDQHLVDGVIVAAPKTAAATAERVARPPLRLVLRPQPPLAVRVHRGGVPIAGLEAGCDLRVVCVGEGGALRGHLKTYTWPMASRTDADGVAQLAPVPAPVRALQLLLADVDGVPIAVRPRPELPRARVEIDVDAWPLTTWQVLAGGEPVPGARVLLWPAPDVFPRGVPPPFALDVDRAGRVAARVEPGAWVVVATDGRRLAIEPHTATAGEAATPTLRLEPLARRPGQVVLPDGAPAVGVRFALGGTLLNPLTDATPRDRLLRHFVNTINIGLVNGVHTGADGRFELWFLHVAGVEQESTVIAHDQPGVRLEPGEDVVVQLKR